jgi:hypothetical protein
MSSLPHTASTSQRGVSKDQIQYLVPCHAAVVAVRAPVGVLAAAAPVGVLDAAALVVVGLVRDLAE